MVNLFIGDAKDEKNKFLEPIAIVKGTHNKIYNKIIFIDKQETTDKGEDIPSKITNLDCPLSNSFTILPTVDPNGRDIFYVAGKSGSGKSYICKSIIENYNKLFPDRQIFLISKLERDETIDSAKAPIRRLNIEEFIKTFDINNYFNCLFMFDDYDTIEGGYTIEVSKPDEKKKRYEKIKYADKIKTIIDDIAIMGRRHGDGQGAISLLLCTHFITDYKKTRLILNEASHYVFFPQSTSYNLLKYVLMNYVGLDSKESKAITKLGRWVCFKRTVPQCIISQQDIKLLNVSQDE